MYKQTPNLGLKKRTLDMMNFSHGKFMNQITYKLEILINLLQYNLLFFFFFITIEILSTTHP